MPHLPAPARLTSTAADDAPSDPPERSIAARWRPAPEQRPRRASTTPLGQCVPRMPAWRNQYVVRLNGRDTHCHAHARARLRGPTPCAAAAGRMSAGPTPPKRKIPAPGAASGSNKH